jgi:hypothetical protein
VGIKCRSARPPSIHISSPLSFSTYLPITKLFYNGLQGRTYFALLDLIVDLYLQTGDKVEYRPIGGASDNVAHSVGEITGTVEEDGVCLLIIEPNVSR